jgi:hypothetical protein
MPGLELWTVGVQFALSLVFFLVLTDLALDAFHPRHRVMAFGQTRASPRTRGSKQWG